MSNSKTPTASTERDYQIDNIRCILIFLTIFAHVIESFPELISQDIYRLIYSFHMPAFIFISGMLARFDVKKILKHLVLPYVVFQVIYLLYDSLYNPGGRIVISFTRPHWILWFLMTIITCYLFIPFLDIVKNEWIPIVLLAGFAISLLVGFDETVDYYLSLSRTIVFFPFFAMGYYSKKLKEWDIIKKLEGNVVVTVILSVMLIGSEAALLYLQPSFSVIFCSSPYSRMLDAVVRAIVLICAFLWIMLLFRIVPKREIKFISYCGGNTLPVFLLHGFIVRYIKTTSIFHFNQAVNLGIALVITIVMLVVLNAPFIKKIFRILF